MKRAILSAVMFLAVLNLYSIEVDALINTNTVKMYEHVEISVGDGFDAGNPYDYSNINMRAYFKDSTGNITRTDGFYMNDFEYAGGNDYKRGSGSFKARFAPKKIGKWQYRINIYQGKEVLAKSSWKEFVCVKDNDDKGFIRKSDADPLFVEFENKKPFFAKGVNLCWSSGKVLEDYEKWLDSYKDNGVNFIRLWMAPWSFGIEKDKLMDYSDRQKQAFMLDKVFEMATQRDIYIMLCFVLHEEFSTVRNSEWKGNPYSSENKGPLQKPEEFFTSKKAKENFKNRIRYIVARWGYSKNLFAWELFNEVDLTDNYNTENVRTWHAEMFSEIKKYDINKHLLSTSFSNPALDDVIWKMKEIDFTQTHMYWLKDTAVELNEKSKSKIQKFSKPHIVSEFGISTENEFADKGMDRKGVHLHNGIWSTAFSLSFGYGMPWYWDYYIDKYDLYYNFKNLSDFLEGINWARSDFYDLYNKKVEFESGDGRRGGDVKINLAGSWGKAKGDKLILKNDGNVINKDKLTGFLYGSDHADMKTVPLLVMKNTVPGKLVVRCDEVSGNNKLTVKVNSEIVFEEQIDAVDISGNTLVTKVNVDKVFVIDLHIGDNEIEIENTGKDWIKVTSMTVTDFMNPKLASVYVSGVQSEKSAFIWIKNNAYTWETPEPDTIDESFLYVEGLLAARYITKVIDTYSGETIKEQQDIIDEGDKLKINLPTFKKDVAVKVERYKDIKK